MLTQARKLCGATAALLIVMDGERGGGFACQAPLQEQLRIPAVLRFIADQIEADLRQGKL